MERSVRIESEGITILTDLVIPKEERGVVIFAHGSGSGRKSPRNTMVAERLNAAGFGTLLVDLLTEEEAREDEVTLAYRFNVALLASRLIIAADWMSQQSNLPLGYYGSSTGAAAALIAAADRPELVTAIVSRGGRTDLAGGKLQLVKAPTLLIVGGLDAQILVLNRASMTQMAAEVRLETIAGASHLFEEPGKLEKVAKLAVNWFQKYF